MHLPRLKKENRYKRSIINFGGINLTGNYSPGELSDCTGITHSEFPFITQRKKSENTFSCNFPTAAIFGNAECIAAEDGLYYNRKKVGDLSPGKKQLVILGKRIVVFPDKMYYDTETTQFKSLSGEVSTSGAKVTFTENSISVQADFSETIEESDTLFFSKGRMIATYEKASVSNGSIALSGFALKESGAIESGTVFKENCEENQYRVAESVIYSEENETYEIINILVTVKKTASDLFSDFKEGDVIEVSGCTEFPENNRMATISSVKGTIISFTDGIFKEGYETGNITVKRKIPEFTSVCSYENRIWGIEGNTIYASALGDATAFFTYKGISTDSFTVTSNSAGDFTACASYGNSCFFFKENTCYKLYGNRPANFQLNESFGTGILKNDSDSIATAGDKLIYKGNGGIYSFYGGTPRRISDNIGKIKMENASAGSNGKLYYLSVDTEGGREEFVWDIEKNLWCNSGVCDVIGYSVYGEKVYRLRKDGIEEITSETDSDALWSITMCPFDEGYHGTKNYSRIRIKAQLFEGAYIQTEIKDDEGIWKTVNISHGDRKKYINIPCIVKSCHELRIRLSGKGKSILENVTREFSVN